MPAKHTPTPEGKSSRACVCVCVCVWCGDICTHTHTHTRAWVAYIHKNAIILFCYSSHTSFYLLYPNLYLQGRWVTKGKKYSHTNTQVYSKTYNSKLKNKTNAPADLLSHSAFSLPLSLLLHCFLSVTCSGGKEARLKKILPTLLISSLFLTNLLPFFSPAFVYTFSPTSGGGKMFAKEGRERSSFNLPHSCDHLQPEALFSSVSNQRGEEKEGCKEGGGVIVVLLSLSIFHPENKSSVLLLACKKDIKKEKSTFAVKSLSLSSYCASQTGRHLSQCPLRSRRDLPTE